MVDELDFKKEESHFFEKRGELIKRNFAKSLCVRYHCD